MKSFKIVILSVLIIWTATSLGFKTVDLKDLWKMVITSCPKQFSHLIGKQFDVSVPSTLHLILQKYKQIPNPYFGQNLKSLATISDCSVKFITNITINRQMSQYPKVSLKFQGIDTYSTIYFNNAKLGTTQNAFLRYQFDIKPFLKEGINTLIVEIKSSKPITAQKQKRSTLPTQWAHSRKPAYQHSWDWAPYMNTLGIWLPASLTFYKQTKMQYVWIRDRNITKSKAILDLKVALDGIIAKQDVKSKSLVLEVINKNTKQVHKFNLINKENTFELNIYQPKLWWPNNIGDPYVYQFQVSLLKHLQILDKRKVVYGIRTVKLNSEGQNFQIIVNGEPIYCKGANYVPPDMMYSRLINKDFQPANTIESLLNDAVESNFNMLRVWGGGQYETDQFYEMASRKGIMIFQDFMFSDSIYPGSWHFLENVKKQVVYQVRRLRNYPAIVFLSGNNEILQGILDWGWGMPIYKRNYQKLFVQLIPKILNVQWNYLPYIQSSPSKGVGNYGFYRGGNVHYWGVWAGREPFQQYQTAYGGFNNEFGTQSLPVWQTIVSFTRPQDRMYQSQELAFHEKHLTKFNVLKFYISKYSKDSINFQMQAFNSGLVQAFGIQIAIRAQRCSKPKSFGTLYWQFNDAWPAISWSSIDYYGRWKPLQYSAKKYYKDIILFYHHYSRKFIAINDKLVNVKCNYTIKVMTFKGDVLYQNVGSIELKPNQKRELHGLQPKFYVSKEQRICVYTEITYGIHEDDKTALTTFLKPMKDLDLPVATLKVKYEYKTNEIIVQSDFLVKNLYISSTKQYLRFSDNYFDMIPNKPYKVKLLNCHQSLFELKPTMLFRSYQQISSTAGLNVKVIN